MKISRTSIVFSTITLLIGFMVAVQYKSVKDPLIRDTRNMWQVREDLAKELELQSKLLTEKHRNEELINKYKTQISGSKETILKQTLDQFKKEAGQTAAEGPGIVLTIEPFDEALLLGEKISSISPIIIQRLVNELNMYGAKQIAIDGERMINSTVIREINGETKINNHALTNLPVQIQVITENHSIAEKLYNRMQVSQAIEDFFIDNLRVKVSLPQESITIPPFTDPINVRYMETADEKGES